jgi:hypothetical protein
VLGLTQKDLLVLGGLIGAGADLSQPRHVVYYTYAPGEDAARSMRDEVEAHGFRCWTQRLSREYAGQRSVDDENDGWEAAL